MKIFSASQIKACDAYTIHAAGIQSIELMERAANACVSWITEFLPNDALFIVLCGPGNNGGDGLAITRLLHRKGYGAKAFLLKFTDELSPDCNKNLERLQNIDEELVDILEEDMYVTDVPEHVYIIDAILGTGINRAVEGWVANFIEHINELPNYKVAIDVPSGMPVDNIPDEEVQMVKADHTLSFQFYKRAFLHPETGSNTGYVHVLDIGLHPTFIESTHTSYRIIDSTAIADIYTQRDLFTHKGDYGHALIVAGSHGMMGAAVLAVKAAMRSGAGKVTALVPECGYNIIQSAMPEVMCKVCGDKYINKVSSWESMDVVGLGPGISTNENAARAVAEFITACKEPIVVDADALNIMAERKELLGKLPADSILTPHPKEFDRLFGDSTNSMQRLEKARTQAMRYNIIIVLKGRCTTIVTPEGECWYNLTGNPGMATAGSGDVLTGIITGLVAQGYTPEESAKLGVYIHGLAGNFAAQKLSQEAMIAGDIIDRLGKAFRTISNH